MYFPYFGPKVLKLGLIFFTNTPVVSVMYSISFTFTSERMIFFTASNWPSICSFRIGIINLLSGWRTRSCTLRRNPRTMDDIFWASSIRSSSKLSINCSFATGNVVKCTLPVWRPVTLFRSWNSLSI